MRRLLTGHAMNFNRGHRQSGKLIQNRYKSNLCQEDTYLLELVGYIHLNPIRARLVADIKALDKYPFCGHTVIIFKSDERVLGDSDFVERVLKAADEFLERKYQYKCSALRANISRKWIFTDGRIEIYNLRGVTYSLVGKVKRGRQNIEYVLSL